MAYSMRDRRGSSRSERRKPGYVPSGLLGHAVATGRGKRRQVERAETEQAGGRKQRIPLISRLLAHEGLERGPASGATKLETGGIPTMVPRGSLTWSSKALGEQVWYGWTTIRGQESGRVNRPAS